MKSSYFVCRFPEVIRNASTHLPKHLRQGHCSTHARLAQVNHQAIPIRQNMDYRQPVGTSEQDTASRRFTHSTAQSPGIHQNAVFRQGVGHLPRGYRFALDISEKIPGHLPEMRLMAYLV